MISKHHTEFIRLVASGETQKHAYYLSNPNKTLSKGTIDVESSKLAKRYAKEIQQAKQQAANIVQQANESDIAQNALKSILTQAQVDAKLCDIINGKPQLVQQLNSQGKVFKAEITPTIADQTKAIDLYNKRFGSNEAIKQDINITEEKKSLIKLPDGTTIEI
jgi:hypothetical protein